MNGLEIASILIRHFEGCRLHAYVLPGENWATIGWGHAVPLVERDKLITQADADELLLADLQERDQDLQDQLGRDYAQLSTGQLGATLSFKYNCKPVLFDNSTFLMLLKQGAYVKAQAEFKRWIYGEGRSALPGLIRRRRCEEFVFGGGSLANLAKLNWFL